MLAGSLVQNSDQRLKTNIQDLDGSSSLAEIEALNPVTFNWIDPAKSSVPQFGFIAQQVQTVFPNLVSTTSPTALTPDGTLQPQLHRSHLPHRRRDPAARQRDRFARFDRRRIRAVDHHRSVERDNWPLHQRTLRRQHVRHARAISGDGRRRQEEPSQRLIWRRRPSPEIVRRDARASYAEFVGKSDHLSCDGDRLREACDSRSERRDLFVELLDRGDDRGDEIDVLRTACHRG